MNGEQSGDAAGGTSLKAFRGTTEKKRYEIVKNYISRLAGGALGDSLPLAQLYLEANGCGLENSEYLLAMVSPEHFSAAGGEINGVSDLYSGLINDVETALAPNCDSFTFELGGALLAVLFVPDGVSRDSFMALCLQLFESLRGGYARDRSIALKFYISDITHGVTNLRHEYAQLRIIQQYDRDYLAPIQGRNVYTVASMKRGDPERRRKLMQLCDKLSQQIKAHGVAAHKQYSEALISLVEMEPYTRSALLGRIQLVIDALSNELTGRSIIEDEELFSFMSDVEFANDLNELKLAWENSFSALTAAIQHGSEGKKVDYHEIAEYMEENVTSPWLNVTAVAEHFGVSPTVLSVRFKRVFGVVPLDYIRNKRLEYACLLLENDEMTISDVAAASGYGSTISMQRDFRRFLNTTPSAMRNELLRNK